MSDETTDTVITPEERARRGIRGWSRRFSPTGKAHRYLLEAIPAQLWISARARAKREGVSMRTLILRLLTDYVEGRP